MGEINWELLEKYKKVRSGEEELGEDEKLTLQMLADDWKENIYPPIEENKLKPLIKRMEKLRYEYYKALKDYYEILDDCRGKVRDLHRLEPFMNPFMFNELHHSNHMRKLPLISPQQLNYIRYRKELPDFDKE